MQEFYRGRFERKPKFRGGLIAAVFAVSMCLMMIYSLGVMSAFVSGYLGA